MIYITGDTHGDIKRFDEKYVRRLKRNDYIIICGDFGFLWAGGAEEERLLEKLRKKKYCILFVDGKHENFDLLERYRVINWHGGKVHQLGDNLYHLMRGQVFDLEQKRIFTFGGGESIDKDMRQAQGTWWEREMPTLEDMQEAVVSLNRVDRRVDYIITHEPPARVKTIMNHRPDSINALDAFLEEISKEVKFEKWFFGCTHQDRKITSKHYSVFQDLLPAEPKIQKSEEKKSKKEAAKLAAIAAKEKKEAEKRDREAKPGQ